MSLRPIVLWTPQAKLTSDDACTSIVQYPLALPPSTIRPPYQPSPEDTANATSSLSYVPPLSYFCIKTLIDYADQVHELGPSRLRYERPAGRHDFDILQALIPTYRPFDSANHQGFDLRVVDPRLWAVLAQIFENLPGFFRSYTLPLSDPYLPMLQTIPSTEHFSLITVLSLSRCRELTDDTVQELRHLHTLSAFDASVTALGSWGVQRLSKCLSWSDADGSANQPPVRRGPWGLRVLYLKDCINIDDEVLQWLPRFPLLSVVGGSLSYRACQSGYSIVIAFRPAWNDMPTMATSTIAFRSLLEERVVPPFSSRRSSTQSCIADTRCPHTIFPSYALRFERGLPPSRRQLYWHATVSKGLSI